LPTVLSPAEVDRLLEQLDGTYGLMGELLYGSGLRTSDCVRLRVKDVDFDYGQIIVRNGKGEKDRVTVLPVCARKPLEDHLAQVRRLFEADQKAGLAGVYIWPALERSLPHPPWAPRHSPVRGHRKYPSAGKKWVWQ
jgi:integrase